MHFASKYQKSTFTLPIEVCYFIIKNNFALDVKKIMSSFDFGLGLVLHCDPHYLISNQRFVFKYFSYIHHNNHGLEMLENKEMWEYFQALMQESAQPNQMNYSKVESDPLFSTLAEWQDIDP
jgi:hypothetical protein